MAAEGKLDPVVGRDREITRLIQILSRRSKNNPCLVGEPGVGKTAIVEGLAQRIVSGLVPDSVRDKRVVVLDMSGMVAGSKYRGEFEERIRKVIDEVRVTREFFFLLMNFTQSLAPEGQKVLMAAFQSVTPRTAGFNTVDLMALSESATLLTMMLMFVGAGSVHGAASK